jgi:hypothetical protein
VYSYFKMPHELIPHYKKKHKDVRNHTNPLR